jgi:signal transduction histidine kinase
LYNEVTNQLLSTIFQKRITIKTNFEVKTIKYPRVYFESILYNLLSNAIKYSSTERPPEIFVETVSNNNQVQLKVKDNGIGIDLDKHRDSIFKLNKTFHEGFDSKGVGLFITKTQIETLGGSIMVNSEVNKGTEFIVTL